MTTQRLSSPPLGAALFGDLDACLLKTPKRSPQDICDFSMQFGMYKNQGLHLLVREGEGRRYLRALLVTQEISDEERALFESALEHQAADSHWSRCISDK